MTDDNKLTERGEQIKRLRNRIYFQEKVNQMQPNPKKDAQMADLLITIIKQFVEEEDSK